MIAYRSVNHKKYTSEGLGFVWGKKQSLNIHVVSLTALNTALELILIICSSGCDVRLCHSAHYTDEGIKA